MVGKKKLLSMFLFTLFVIFSGFISESTCKAVTLEDYQLTEPIMQAILEEIGVWNSFSGDGVLTTTTNNFNTMMRTVRARGDYHLVTLDDCFFFKTAGNTFDVAFNDYRNNFIDNNDASLECYSFYIPFFGNINDTSAQRELRGFVNWSYDGNNNITGVGLNTSSVPRWHFTTTSYSFLTTVTTNNISSGIITVNNRGVATSSGLFLNNSSIDGQDMVLIYSRTNSGYGMQTYLNYLYLDDFNSGDLPTPTPTPTDSGGSGSGTDLTTTNGLITNVINSLNDTPSGDDFTLPSSGDLINSLNVPDINEDEKVSATNNFWLAITNGLTSAFNDDVRYYHLDFLSIDTVIDNQAFSPPSIVIEVFSFICNLGFVFVEYKLIRKLVNMFSSGIFSQILRAYSRIDISDLF